MAGGEGVWVVGTEYVLAAGADPFSQGDGLVYTPGLLV